jgi:hypothetical protein
MAVVSVIALAVFDIIVCAVEIPKMRKQKMGRELAVFFILLLLGTTAAVMSIFDMKVPNPSDLLAWFFSPIADFMKLLLKAD